MKLFLKITLITLVLISCLKEKAEPNLSSLNCSNTISFNTDVLAIFDSYQCSSSSCHSTSNAAHGIILDTYNGTVNVNTAKLLGSIEQISGYKAMPFSGKLTPTEINLIKCWIKQGKQNN